MAGSATLEWGEGARAPSRRRLRSTPTLIPVTLRLLDESGKHGIAERMLGIMTEVSSRGFEVRVLGPAGRPLARGLSRKQMALISFLDSELHEKVESMACALSAVDSGRHPDAWTVHLKLPQLPSELLDEIFEALRRYAPETEPQVPWRTLGVAAGLTALIAMAASGGRSAPTVAASEGLPRLERQLAYSHQTVERLSLALEEADQEIERQSRVIQAYAAEASDLETARVRPAVASAPERAAPPTAATASEVRLRDASWEDFRAVVDIRGARATPRLAYLDGDIEMSSPSAPQKRVTRSLTRLLGAYAVARNVDLRALGPRTLTARAPLTGIEPEEAFALAGDEGRPDIVFEVAAEGQVEPLLEVYRRIAVPELWIRVGDRLDIYRYLGNDYLRGDSSGVLPGLDIETFSAYLGREDQTQATQDLLDGLSP